MARGIGPRGSRVRRAALLVLPLVVPAVLVPALLGAPAAAAHPALGAAASAAAPGPTRTTATGTTATGTTATGAGTATTSAAGTATAAAPTLFGATIWTAPGQGYAAAFARSDQTYGGLDITRVFYGGAPQPWPSNAGYSGRPVVVSFRVPPAKVLDGSNDAALRAWFATAPTDRDVFWVYSHEPEDNIERGEFTATQYRAAWRRVAGLAAAARNPHLRATLVLMCWSVGPLSGRQWRDYYPGDDVIAVMAFDCYNWDARHGRYAAPEDMYPRAIAAAASVGKPWGMAEIGSLLVSGDSGAGRAAWLRAAGAYLRDAGALFVTYFDMKLNADYRLLDTASQRAWREFCAAA